MTHICVGKLIIIGSDNGLSPERRQAIIWTNAGIWLTGPLGTNFSEILIEIHTFSFKKMHLKMSSEKWRLFCRGLNVLIQVWMNNYILYNVQRKETYSFPNFSDATVEVWEWIIILSHILLCMWLLIHVGIKVNPSGLKLIHVIWDPVVAWPCLCCHFSTSI